MLRVRGSTDCVQSGEPSGSYCQVGNKTPNALEVLVLHPHHCPCAKHTCSKGGKMRKLFILVAVILATAGSAVAQDFPKAEIFGGYQYIRLNPRGGGSGANCQGPAGSVSG